MPKLNGTVHRGYCISVGISLPDFTSSCKAILLCCCNGITLFVTVFTFSRLDCESNDLRFDLFIGIEKSLFCINLSLMKVCFAFLLSLLSAIYHLLSSDPVDYQTTHRTADFFRVCQRVVIAVIVLFTLFSLFNFGCSRFTVILVIRLVGHHSCHP